MSAKAEDTKPAEPVTFESRYSAIQYPEAPGGPIQFSPNDDPERPRGTYTTADPEQIAYLDQTSTAARV